MTRVVYTSKIEFLAKHLNKGLNNILYGLNGGQINSQSIKMEVQTLPRISLGVKIYIFIYMRGLSEFLCYFLATYNILEYIIYFKGQWINTASSWPTPHRCITSWSLFSISACTQMCTFYSSRIRCSWWAPSSSCNVKII